MLSIVDAMRYIRSYDTIYREYETIFITGCLRDGAGVGNAKGVSADGVEHTAYSLRCGSNGVQARVSADELKCVQYLHRQFSAAKRLRIAGYPTRFRALRRVRKALIRHLEIQTQFRKEMMRRTHQR